MKAILNHRWFALGLRLILGGIFVYAGIVKIQAPQAFADSIAGFQLLPAEFINLLALALPPLEIVLGAMLVIGWQKRLASLGVFVLCGVFLFALASALLRNIPVDCGCFGGGQPSRGKTVVGIGRDVILTLAAWVLYRRGIMQSRLTES